MWLMIQCVVMIAVLWANIYWKWTPNSVLAGLLAVGAAYCVTRWPRSSVAVLVAVVVLVVARG
jgi:hypothetical protein